MEYNRRGGGVYVRNAWCGGVIKDVSTASSVDTTGAKRRKLGLGHIWVEYDDGTGSWLLATRPTFYNANKPGGWRLVKEEELRGEEEKYDDDDDDDVPGDLEDPQADDEYDEMDETDGE